METINSLTIGFKCYNEGRQKNKSLTSLRALLAV